MGDYAWSHAGYGGGQMGKEKTQKLTPKQKRFVDEFLIDLNATQAAIRAGYSEKTAGSIGSENLTKPEILDALSRAKAERCARTEITKDLVVQELYETYKICSVKIPKVSFDGEQVTDINGNLVWRMVDAAQAVSALDKLMKHVGGYDADNKRELSGEVAFTWGK